MGIERVEPKQQAIDPQAIDPEELKDIIGSILKGGFNYEKNPDIKTADASKQTEEQFSDNGDNTYYIDSAGTIIKKDDADTSKQTPDIKTADASKQTKEQFSNNDDIAYYIGDDGTIYRKK